MDCIGKMFGLIEIRFATVALTVVSFALLIGAPRRVARAW